MVNSPEDLLLSQETDAIDEYFECVTACSLDEEGVECVTHCVQVHLRGEAEN